MTAENIIGCLFVTPIVLTIYILFGWVIVEHICYGLYNLIGLGLNKTFRRIFVIIWPLVLIAVFFLLPIGVFFAMTDD